MMLGEGWLEDVTEDNARKLFPKAFE